MSYLKQPWQRGNLSVKNRLVMPPMATAKANEDGTVSEGLLAYYDEKSKGGYLGLIVIEHSFVIQEGKAGPSQLNAAKDFAIGGLRELADVIHKNGVKAVIQLNHAGSAANPDLTGSQPVGPSAVLHPKSSIIPREFSSEEIAQLVSQFADAAVRVKKAGFDGVEIHGAHGYLLSQFLSPLTNKRTDAYGGSIENRARIHTEILRAVRSAVGEDFPVFIRLGGCDYMEGGLTMEDGVAAAVLCEKAGADLLDISGGHNGDTIPGVKEPGYFSPLSRKIKDAVSIPVLVTGGVTEAKHAEEILERGDADFVGVGKAILRDSNWPKKAMESL